MHLYSLPLYFILIGLVLYTVLGGADFGAGLWQLTAGRGHEAERRRDHAHHALAPVWEANHVWLVFVLTVTWTAYPVVFGSVASTLSVPLFIAAIGIIFRGTTYALGAGASGLHERRVIESVFALSSILTPFALGTITGGIASGRVPVGNAAGDLWTSWVNPTSMLIGVLAVVIGGFLAAVYLCADAVRVGEPDLEDWFRRRALASGILAGALALGGLGVLSADSPALYHGLVTGPGLPALVVSALAGLATQLLVWVRRYGPARASAALAVAAIVTGWALAQSPNFLPGLTVQQAAAPRDTLIAVTVAVLGGAIILFPSLSLLFSLVLRGRFDPGRLKGSGIPPVQAQRAAGKHGLAGRVTGALFLAGFGLLTVAGSEWAHALGVLCLAGFVVVGVYAVAPAEVAADSPGGPGAQRG
jgi:cytochrome d ubiquinol oxidase subunit II